MIKKPEGYDQAQAYTGEFASLPAGCYVCVIKQVSQTETQSHRPQLAVLFDIAEGDQKGFYQSQYDNARKTGTDVKWKGVHKQIMDGSSLPFFKGLMTSIEKSNPGYTFQWGVEGNERTLVGKKFGAVMGREEFLTQKGERRFATKVVQIRSLDGLKEAEVPEDKLLTDADIAEWNRTHMPVQPAPAADPSLAADGFMNIPDGIDEKLPFM